MSSSLHAVERLAQERAPRLLRGLEAAQALVGELEQLTAVVVGVGPPRHEPEGAEPGELAGHRAPPDADGRGQVARPHPRRRGDEREERVGGGFEVGVHVPRDRGGGGLRTPQEEAELALELAELFVDHGHILTGPRPNIAASPPEQKEAFQQITAGIGCQHPGGETAQRDQVAR